MEIKILLLMILCHIIDDFVLQPICLSKLKQKEWWKTQKGYKDLYKNDYKMALFIHSISWSIMIMLPFLLMPIVNNSTIGLMFLINTSIHYLVDNLKANKGVMNLVEDQSIHLIQVGLTWAALSLT